MTSVQFEGLDKMVAFIRRRWPSKGRAPSFYDGRIYTFST